MISLKEKVRYCLENFPETRNSDIKLTNALWIHFYPDKITRNEQNNALVRLLDLYTLPSQDNIKRWRAKFNQNGEFLPSDIEVINRRSRNAEVWHEEMV